MYFVSQQHISISGKICKAILPKFTPSSLEPLQVEYTRERLTCQIDSRCSILVLTKANPFTQNCLASNTQVGRG